MRVLIQRVLRASVHVDNEVVGSIGQGYLLLVGVEKGDGATQVEQAVAKLIKLRLFEDDNGKTNLNLLQVAGQALVVSQFTLAASLKRAIVLALMPQHRLNWLKRFTWTWFRV